MKKNFSFLYLAAYMVLPSLVSAQSLEITVMDPMYVTPTAASLHVHVNELGDMADGDTATLVYSYGEPGGTVNYLQPIYLTNYSGIHQEVGVFGLDPETDYNTSACVYYAGDTVCSDVLNFETEEVDYDEPFVSTDGYEYATSISVTLTGEIDNFGSYETSNGYFKYGQDPYFTDFESEQYVVKQPYSDFEIDVKKNIQPQKLYYFTACAENPSGEDCGETDFFNTTSPGIIDIVIDDFEQIGTCMMEIWFHINAQGRPDQYECELKVGNPGEGAFFTKVFQFDEESHDFSIIVDYAPLVMAGIDLDPLRTIFVLTADSYGVTGKVSGTLAFAGEACNDEFPGAPKLAAEDELFVYPNPTTESIFIKSVEGGRIDVLDLSGRVIETHFIPVGVTEVSLDHLPAGAYFVEYHHEGTRTMEKIIKL